MFSDKSSNISSSDSTDPASTASTTGRLDDILSLRPFSPLPLPLPLPVSDVASPSSQNPAVVCISDHATVRGATPSNHQNSIDEDDIVIAVMGLTGAGKSSFVNTAAARTEVVIGNDLKSQTRAPQPVRCLHPDGRRNIVLVDTPGFDDTHLSDTQILRIIAHWLKETYRNKIKLSGLLYLHRISDVRMAGTPLRNLSVFRDLCGDHNLKNIVLVTTMWDDVRDQSVGAKREEELLSDFWKDMIQLGSRTCRFQGTHESAWEIINHLDLERSHQTLVPLQIQEEMVDRNLQFNETTAAKTLFRYLVQLAGDFKKRWDKLRNKDRRANSPKGPSNGIRLPTFPRRSPSIRSIGSKSSKTTWSVVSSPDLSRVVSRGSTSPSSPADSTYSGCINNGRGEALSAAIRVLKLAHQMSDISHVPMLRGIIGTVLHIAQLIEEMGGTHHAINQVIESSAWLLEEITQHAAKSKLPKDMKRTLRSFQTEIINLRVVVTRISSRGRIARFFLHDADIQTITACTVSIKEIYDKLEVKLAIDNRQAIARLEDQLTVLCTSTAMRKCECGMPIVPLGESQGDGQPSTSTSRPL